jgi:alpha-glucosidase
MSLGLAGIVFGGADIPGFNGTPTDEIFIQFYQVGVYYPFFRAHCNMADPPGNMGVKGATREPWLQTERVQNVIRESIYHRYDLILYIYSLFYEASTKG